MTNNNHVCLADDCCTYEERTQIRANKDAEGVKDDNQLSIDGQIDVIFKKVDELCWEGKWDEIDEMLENVDVKNEPLSILISYLSITLCISEKLKKRKEFYRKTFHRIVYAENATPHRIYRLLSGLA